MSSDYKVPYTTILDVQPLTNSDRLELATVYGWQVVVAKGRYKIGSQVIYIPIDSILPENIETLIFPPDSKIKLSKSRVRQIRIRGAVSQGMIIDPSELASIVNLDRVSLESDLAEILNIQKFEPPIKYIQVAGSKKQTRLHETKNFHKYSGLGNIKWYPNMFKETDEVVIQEKLHGTNARAALLPFEPFTLWQKILKFLNLAPKYHKAYGSNNVDISAKLMYNGFYGTDVYGDMFKKIDAHNKLKVGETIFGEIIGPGIQKGYSYGLKEHYFVLFDVKVLQEDGSQIWLNPDEVEQFAKERGFEMVPILYKGPYNKELAYKLTFGPSEYGDKSEKVREGIVIKKAKDYSIEGNKQAVKWISEDYLSNPDNTDDH